jgi:peptide/nickel transport system substrate-binding protein
VLTAQLRKGVKWSDGQPLTADDWMFYWNDLVLDESVPVVEGAGMRVNGELMTCEKVDDYTLKFTFAVPNPLFLELMSRGFYHSSWYMAPAHYMKQFHPKYEASNANPDELMNRYNNRHQYPDMPTYMPWRTVEFKPGESARLERNPYYWKVDTAGNQLPYIDYMDVQVAESANFSQLITLKAIAGELDMQVRDFPVQDFPTIMENQEQGDYRVIRWERGDYAWPWIMLYYDYPKDKYIEDLMYNQKFRQALSVAIDRARINEIAALGLATPRQFSLSPESPEFQTPEGKAVYEAWSTSYAQHDPDQAKAWLDEIGLKDVDGDGFREREDGSPLELIVEVSIGDPQSIDSCDLLKEDWEAVGLKTTISALDWSVMDQHSAVGEIMIRAWGSAAAWGLISASPVWTPVEGVTYCGGGQRIGQYYQTGGAEGVAPRAGSHLEKLQQAYTELLAIVDPAERDAALLAAYQIHIDEGPITIGTVGQHPSPVVVKNNFRNVPEFGLVAGWDLGFPGTADPEQFFFKT